MAETLNTPSALSQPIAQNGDKNTIPVTNDQSLGLMSQSTGFPPICSQRIADGGKAPRRADFNGIFNLLSQQHFFLQNGGSYTFRQDVSDAIGGYPLNAMLFYVDSSGNVKIVRSMIQNNTFNFVSTPSYIDDGVHWETVIPTKDWVSETFVNLTGSQVISGNKNFTGNLTYKGVNVATGFAVVESYSNGSSGYRIWSDGYCEQWGTLYPSNKNVALLKKYRDINYNLLHANVSVNNIGQNNSAYSQGGIVNESTIFLRAHLHGTTYDEPICWKTSGYLESGQY